MTLRRGAWPVPAKIEHDPAEGWRAVIDETAYPWHQDPAYAPQVDTVWLARFADQADYDWRIAVKRWAERHCPEHPCLHPRRAFRTMTMTLPPFLPRRTTL